MNVATIGRVLGGLALAVWQVSTPAQSVQAHVISVSVQAQPAAPDVECITPARPARPKSPAAAVPLVWPDEADVARQVQAYAATSAVTRRVDQAMVPLRFPAGQSVLRVGIWGDSHLAAGFFTQELQRLSQLPAAQVRSRWAPASLNRPGVRLPLRKTCISPDWLYEPAYAQAAGAALPGPGLVNMLSRQDGAWLALDLRSAAGRAEHTELRLLYQQTVQPLTVGIRVDGAPEQEVQLQGPAGPAVLKLVSQAAMSTLALRVVHGPFRLHGLEWPVAPTVRLQMDVFGYPGATASSWRQVEPTSMWPWWSSTPYDLVVLAFGTNEGNVQPFNAQAYQLMLQAAVAHWREVFPQTACLLIAPGDRGVLVRPSDGRTSKSVTSAVRESPDLMRFTRVHEEIGRIQKQVAQVHGCHAWSFFEAMGGAGGAYRWARHNPAWMAKDLIHFTVPGYQRLAQLMAQDLGWGQSLFQVPEASSAGTRP
jgi:lysophospholipase L1-like esterase